MNITPDSCTRLIAGIIQQAIWDDAHSCYLSRPVAKGGKTTGAWAVNSARWFLYNEKGAKTLIDRYSIPIDIERVRQHSFTKRSLVSKKRRLQRNKYMRDLMRRVRANKIKTA